MVTRRAVPHCPENGRENPKTAVFLEFWHFQPMRSASSSGEGDSDRVSHPKRIDSSEENCGNLSRCAQQIADRGRHREQRGVLTDKTGDLQPQRQAADREQR